MSSHLLDTRSPEEHTVLKQKPLWLIKEFDIKKFEYQLPDEYRLDQQLFAITKELNIQSESFDTEHFLTARYDLKEFFEGKKQLIMESFYRMMRKKYDILMEGKDPLGGKWNYDHENRKKMPKGTSIPPVNSFHYEISDIVSLISDQQVRTIGRIDESNFVWPYKRRCYESASIFHRSMPSSIWYLSRCHDHTRLVTFSLKNFLCSKCKID